MADRSWGTGWPNCNRSKIVTLKRADGLRLPIHVGLSELVAILMDLTEAMGYDIKPKQTWGFACRAIRGSSRPSNHSWGTAVDINAPSNPMGSKLITDIPPAVRALWKAHGFRWGGDYVTRPDAMHMEFMGTLAQARQYVKNLRNFLAAHEGEPPRGYAYPGSVKLHDTGPKVRVWQQALNTLAGSRLVVDGNFGGRTEAAVKAFQTKYHLKVDGEAGPTTWHWLITMGTD